VKTFEANMTQISLSRKYLFKQNSGVASDEFIGNFVKAVGRQYVVMSHVSSLSRTHSVPSHLMSRVTRTTRSI